MLAETGLLGFTLWLLMLATLLAASGAPAPGPGPRSVGLTDALLIAVAGYHMTAIFQGGSYLVLYWLLLGLCLAASGLGALKSPKVPSGG